MFPAANDEPPPTVYKSKVQFENKTLFYEIECQELLVKFAVAIKFSGEKMPLSPCFINSVIQDSIYRSGSSL